jgi:cellulose biosynthesis protein BcsQ
MELDVLSLPALSAPGEIITFYSYKGGAGRTMALANIARRLAGTQDPARPVLMIDWDLEAPSLHQYFNCKPDGPGVLELFEACRTALQGARGVAPPNAEALARSVLQEVNWEYYVCRAGEGSSLYLMRAGCMNDSYGERLERLRWAELFEACPALFRCLAEQLSQHFRYVLVDARAGRSETTGVCTALLPQKLVLAFMPDRLSVEGVQGVAARATAHRRSDEDDYRPLMIYPLPTRLDAADAPQRTQWRHGDAQLGVEGYQPAFERLLGEVYGVPRLSLDSYFDEVLVQQLRLPVGKVMLAQRGEHGGDRFSLARSYEALLEWLEGSYFPWQPRREVELLRAVREDRQAAVNGLAHKLSRMNELLQNSSADEYQQSARNSHAAASRHGLHVVGEAPR